MGVLNFFEKSFFRGHSFSLPYMVRHRVFGVFAFLKNKGFKTSLRFAKLDIFDCPKNVHSEKSKSTFVLRFYHSVDIFIKLLLIIIK